MNQRPDLRASGLCSTTIGFGSKNQGEEKVHGAPLGDADIAQLKTRFGFNPDEKFVVPSEVLSGLRGIEEMNCMLSKHISYRSTTTTRRLPTVEWQLRKSGPSFSCHTLSSFPISRVS